MEANLANEYWDTKGVVDMAALENGRIGLKFAGEDGVQRVLTIPASHAVILIVSLTDFAGKIAKTHDVGDAISDIQKLTVESISVGSARDGSEYSLMLRTVDNLELHLRLPVPTTEALAAGLISTLAEHGRSPADLKGEGPVH